MKDFIERYYPEEHSSYDKLKRVVREAWEAVGADELLALVREMPARCKSPSLTQREDTQSIDRIV
jgi:hypothetical protein